MDLPFACAQTALTSAGNSIGHMNTDERSILPVLVSSLQSFESIQSANKAALGPGLKVLDGQGKGDYSFRHGLED
jgi:hypothetical protein